MFGLSVNFVCSPVFSYRALTFKVSNYDSYVNATFKSCKALTRSSLACGVIDKTTIHVYIISKELLLTVAIGARAEAGPASESMWQLLV
jgi:hypothetical protein